jgi:hypothetical protein
MKISWKFSVSPVLACPKVFANRRLKARQIAYRLFAIVSYASISLFVRQFRMQMPQFDRVIAPPAFFIGLVVPLVFSGRTRCRGVSISGRLLYLQKMYL